MCANASCEGLPSPACLHCHWPPWSHSARRRRPPYGMFALHYVLGRPPTFREPVQTGNQHKCQQLRSSVHPYLHLKPRRPLPARTNSKQHKSMQKQTVAVATKKQHCAPRFPQTLTLNPKGCAKKTQASSRLRTAPFDSSMRARSGQIHGQSASLNYCVKHDTAEGFPRCTQSALLFNPHRALGGRQYPSGSLPPPQAPYAAGGACYS